MSQTTYNEKAPRALPGMLGDVGADLHIRSYGLEGGGGFGLFVVPGTDPEKEVAVPSVGGVVVGCIVHQHPLYDESLSDLADGETAQVLTKGRAWVQTAEPVAPGDTVYVEDATGKIRNDATAATELPSSKIEAYDAGTTLALVSVNLP